MCKCIAPSIATSRHISSLQFMLLGNQNTFNMNPYQKRINRVYGFIFTTLSNEMRRALKTDQAVEGSSFCTYLCVNVYYFWKLECFYHLDTVAQDNNSLTLLLFQHWPYPQDVYWRSSKATRCDVCSSYCRTIWQCAWSGLRRKQEGHPWGSWGSP